MDGEEQVGSLETLPNVSMRTFGYILLLQALVCVGGGMYVEA